MTKTHLLLKITEQNVQLRSPWYRLWTRSRGLPQTVLVLTYTKLAQVLPDWCPGRFQFRPVQVVHSIVLHIFSFCLLKLFLGVAEGILKDMKSLFPPSFQLCTHVLADMFSRQRSVKIHMEFPFNLFLINFSFYS